MMTRRATSTYESLNARSAASDAERCASERRMTDRHRARRRMPTRSQEWALACLARLPARSRLGKNGETRRTTRERAPPARGPGVAQLSRRRTVRIEKEAHDRSRPDARRVMRRVPPPIAWVDRAIIDSMSSSPGASGNGF